MLLGYQLLNIPAWSWYWAAFRISIPAWFSWYWVCFQTLISTWSSWYWVCFQTLISTWSSWYWVCFQILISTWSSWYWVCFQTLISTWSCYWVWFNTLIPAWLLVLGSRIVFWAGMRQVCTWYWNWYKAGIICWVQPIVPSLLPIWKFGLPRSASPNFLRGTSLGTMGYFPAMFHKYRSSLPNQGSSDDI